MVEQIRIADSNNDLVGYVSIEVNGTVQDAMKRLEQLETGRKELKSALSRCMCIIYDCASNSESLLIKEICKMLDILDDIDP